MAAHLAAAAAAARQRARFRRPRRPTIGPWFGRHRTALDNLRQAYPEKSRARDRGHRPRHVGQHGAPRRGIHLSRPAVRLRPGRPRRPGRIEVDGERAFRAARRGERSRTSSSPRISAISSCCRSPAPLRPERHGAVPPAQQSLHRRLHPLDAPLDHGRAAGLARRRRLRAGRASWRRAAMSACWSTRNSRHGIATTFFGRPCETNPLVPMLARHYDCDVYPARCIRLPGNRFRLEIEEKLELAATPTATSTSRPPRSCSTTWSKAGCARIPANGCGSTSAGR